MRNGIIVGTSFLIVLLLIFGFWFIISSPLFANNKNIISLKNSYPVLTDPTVPYEVIYTYQDGSYAYHMTGKFLKLDAKNGMLYIKGTDNKTYQFGTENLLSSPNNADLNKLKSLDPELDNNIRIIWADKRTLVQIQNAYKKDISIPMNIYPENTISIRIL